MIKIAHMLISTFTYIIMIGVPFKKSPRVGVNPFGQKIRSLNISRDSRDHEMALLWWKMGFFFHSDFVKITEKMSL